MKQKIFYLNRLPLSQSRVSPLQTNSLSSSKHLSRMSGSYPFLVTRNSVSNLYSSLIMGPILYLKSHSYDFVSDVDTIYIIRNLYISTKYNQIVFTCIKCDLSRSQCNHSYQYTTWLFSEACCCAI